MFANDLSSSNTITFNYEQNGWGTGTGLADEDGNNGSTRHAWVGTNQVCLTLLPAFIASHAYSVNDEIRDDTSASWQMVTTAGTSTTAPVFSATVGALSSSGPVNFESVGAANRALQRQSIPIRI